MAVPLGMRNPKLYNPVERCGFIDEEMPNYASFKTYRDIYNDTYDYIVPVENEFIPDYVTKERVKTIPGRPNQKEVEQMIYSKMTEERVLVRRLFADICKNKEGYVVKSELFAILLKLCPNLTYEQFEILLRKCNLDKLTVYFFDNIEKEFKILAKKPVYSAHCDTKSSHQKIRATNALYRLKMAALEESFDLKDLLPASCFEPNAILLMPQLREAMCRINIRLTDTEFYKFWEKFDKLNIGSIPMTHLFMMLNLQDNGRPMCGIRQQPSLKLRKKENNTLKRPAITDTYKCLKSSDDDDKHIGAGGVSFPITRNHGWVPQGAGGTNEPDLGKGTRYLAGLKSLYGSHPRYDSVMENLYYIFEAPYQAMLVVFSHYDDRNRGKITIEEALEIFLEYGFSVTLKDFTTFLKDTGCIFGHNFVKYHKLLTKYQTKPELSYTDRAIKLIIKTQYEDIGLKTLTTMSPSEMEKHFIKILHGPYMKLMEELQKKSDSKYTVDQNAFREAIQSQVLGEEIPAKQWQDLLKQLEIDPETERIYYKPFLYQFSNPGHKCKPLCPYPPVKVSTQKSWDTTRYEMAPRDLLFLCIKIEKLLKRRFHFIDKHYKYFDQRHLKIFTENQFYELLKHEKSDITPRELRIIWNIMEQLQPNETSYQEVMKFMMTQLTKTARLIKIKERIDSKKKYFDKNIEILKTFKANQKLEKQKEKENIKNKISLSLNPNTIEPIKIDVKEILEKMKPIIHQYWEDIKSYFINIDIIGSTTIENYQMNAFILKYFPHLSKIEASNLIKSFDFNKNGRFNYVEFLKEFRLTINEELNPTKFDGYTYKLVDKKSKNTYHLSEVREVLRRAMIKKWKNLLSAFKSLDHCKVGLLDIEQINMILKNNNIYLSNDDLYHILTNFDRNMDQKIDYFEFIREILDINLITVN